eukprot:10894056-Lingulodinium_polyedra.AAC.1
MFSCPRHADFTLVSHRYRSGPTPPVSHQLRAGFAPVPRSYTPVSRWSHAGLTPGSCQYRADSTPVSRRFHVGGALLNNGSMPVPRSCMPVSRRYHAGITLSHVVPCRGRPSFALVFRLH